MRLVCTVALQVWEHIYFPLKIISRRNHSQKRIIHQMRIPPQKHGMPLSTKVVTIRHYFLR